MCSRTWLSPAMWPFKGRSGVSSHLFANWENRPEGSARGFRELASVLKNGPGNKRWMKRALSEARAAGLDSLIKLKKCCYSNNWTSWKETNWWLEHRFPEEVILETVQVGVMTIFRDVLGVRRRIYHSSIVLLMWKDRRPHTYHWNMG